jgi:hypothetical protein
MRPVVKSVGNFDRDLLLLEFKELISEKVERTKTKQFYVGEQLNYFAIPIHSILYKPSYSRSKMLWKGGF